MSGRFSKLIALAVAVIAAALLAGCKDGKSHRQPPVPGLELRASPTFENVAADESALAAHIELKAVTDRDVSISSVTLGASGTGNDLIDIRVVEIHLDVDKSGDYDPAADFLIGSSRFDSDDGSARITFTNPLIVSPGAGNERYWLVMYRLNGNGPNGATYSFSIADSSDVSVEYLSGEKTSATNLPLASSILNIVSGGARLNLLAGASPPPSVSVLPGKTSIPVLQFALYNRDPGDITVNSISVTPSGTGDDATMITAAHIHLDSNANGRADAGEPLFASYTYDADDAARDAVGSRTVASGTLVYFVITYDFTGAPGAAGRDFRAGIAATDHIGAEDSAPTPVAVVPSGTTPIEGALITVVEKGALSARLGSHNPAAGTISIGTSQAPVLQIELRADAVEDTVVETFVLSATGSADDTGDITLVGLYDDANGDGVVGSGEVQLATGLYAADNGTLSFGDLNLTVGADETANLLATYDVPTTARMDSTIQAYVWASWHIQARGAESAAAIEPTGPFSLMGDTFEIGGSDTFIPAAPLGTKRFMHTQTTFTDPGDGKAKVLVCGGCDGADVLDTAEVYDPALDAWTVLATSLTRPRMLHSATLLADGQRIVIAGGTDGVAITYNDGEIFDPATYSFTPIADTMCSRRQMHTSVLTAQGDVLYFGGQYIMGSLFFANMTEYYDEALNRFDPVGTPRFVRVLHTMNRLSGGTVVATGGLGFQAGGPRSPTLLKSIQLWSTSPIITERICWRYLDGFGRCGHVAVSLPGGQMLIASGYNMNIFLYTTPPFTGSKAAELFKENEPYLGDESIEIVGEMSAVRFVPIAELLGNGKVLIAGGTDDSLSAMALRSAELYDPSSATFADSTGRMLHGRHRATSSMIPGADGELGTADDMVLITGGLIQYAPAPGPRQITNTAEIYVP